MKAAAVALVPAAARSNAQSGRLEALAGSDPLAFLDYCWKQCRSQVRDYQCRFIKQELIGGQLAPEQEAEVRFRQNPFSVDMTFTRNPGDCARALYVAGKWRDERGEELAWAKPAGVILRAVVPRIKQPIHGSRAQRASRRSIDQFGFDKSFELIMHYSRKGQENGQLDLRYVGPGVALERPTFVLERRLPFDGDESRYPDALLVIHIDQEHLLPTACYSYADGERSRLLGSYVYTDLRINTGLGDSDFDPDLIDF